MTDPVRPERAALLELDALLGILIDLATEGDRARYDDDARYRWVIQRLWIAVGNEAGEVQRHLGVVGPWRGLYLLRNALAHRRLPDIDEDLVWRTTSMRPPSLRRAVRDMLR